MAKSSSKSSGQSSGGKTRIVEKTTPPPAAETEKPKSESKPEPRAEMKAEPKAESRPEKGRRPIQSVKPTREQIQERAQAIWRQKGCPAGQDENNWLEAEDQLKHELNTV